MEIRKDKTRNVLWNLIQINHSLRKQCKINNNIMMTSEHKHEDDIFRSKVQFFETFRISNQALWMLINNSKTSSFLHRNLTIIRVFCSCPILLNFFKLFQTFFSRIVCINKFLLITHLSLFQTSMFWYSTELQNLSQTFNANIKFASCGNDYSI